MPKGLYTEWELAHGKDGHSPEMLHYLDMTDGEFERHGAELRADQADTLHKIDLIRLAGLHALDTVHLDPALRAEAQRFHDAAPAGPSVDELIEVHVVPVREAFLAEFESNTAPVARTAGANEEAFLKLVGDSK